MASKKYELRLYITGNSPESKKTIKRLKDILGEELEGKYKLEVIDIKENPQIAEEEKILVTPVVEKKLPKPVKRIVGKLSDKEEVLSGLNLALKKGKKDKSKEEKSRKRDNKKSENKKNTKKEKR